MNKNYYKIGFTLLLWLYAAIANAADINAGKNRSAVCQGCHGVDGISINPVLPNLASQGSAYIEAQLHKFKSGTRDNPTMKPFADGLSDADIQNLAAYFASLPAKSAGGDTVLAKQGKDKTTMCMGCHGQQLLGQGQFPRLAGQHPEYLGKQLHDFKNGARKEGHMNAVAQSLSEDDITSIAAYLGTLAN